MAYEAVRVNLRLGYTIIHVNNCLSKHCMSENMGQLPDLKAGKWRFESQDLLLGTHVMCAVSTRVEVFLPKKDRERAMGLQ